MAAKIDIQSLKKQAENEIKSAQTLKDLDDAFRVYLGRKGQLTEILRSLADLNRAERVKLGKQANELRDSLQLEFEQKQRELMQKEAIAGEQEEWIDVTAPGEKIRQGHLHPLTQVLREAQEIFLSMGFAVAEGPEIETAWYNFDALNIPENHPARDLWDTFWIKSPAVKKTMIKERDKLLLRTHTSPMQVRYMQSHQPPFQIIVPGRAFRYEATNANHEFDLMQIEGLVVGEHTSAANFKAVIEEFYSQFFQKKMNVRLRPSFFPFVEPGFEVDMSCVVCSGKGLVLSERSESKGCSSCEQSGWLEMMGAGMVHQKVFKNAGYKPGRWQGFAFGMGLERLAMMKYKIDDIRLFRSGDLRFLRQF